MKILRTILAWLFIIGVFALIFYVGNSLDITLPKFNAFPTMSGLQALFFGLSLAFLWVEVLKWGGHKPFNCLKCMCGWFTLALAFLFHVELWYLYLPAGLMVGALFSAVKMRWL